MGDNLPPGVSISDDDAPWNQTHPEPDWQCTNDRCDRYGLKKEVRGPNPECPECGSEITDY